MWTRDQRLILTDFNRRVQIGLFFNLIMKLEYQRTAAEIEGGGSRSVSPDHFGLIFASEPSKSSLDGPDSKPPEQI